MGTNVTWSSRRRPGSRVRRTSQAHDGHDQHDDGGGAGREHDRVLQALEHQSVGEHVAVVVERRAREALGRHRSVVRLCRHVDQCEHRQHEGHDEVDAHEAENRPAPASERHRPRPEALAGHGLEAPTAPRDSAVQQHAEPCEHEQRQRIGAGRGRDSTGTRPRARQIREVNTQTPAGMPSSAGTSNASSARIAATSTAADSAGRTNGERHPPQDRERPSAARRGRIPRGRGRGSGIPHT